MASDEYCLFRDLPGEGKQEKLFENGSSFHLTIWLRSNHDFHPGHDADGSVGIEGEFLVRGVDSRQEVDKNVGLEERGGSLPLRADSFLIRKPVFWKVFPKPEPK